MTLEVEARDVTHDSTVDLDDPVRRRHVAPQSRPPSLEGGSIMLIRRSESGHQYRIAIRPVLEQHVEIAIFDLAKDKLSRALPHAVTLTVPHTQVSFANAGTIDRHSLQA